jgi:uncharacterized membrane protein YdcZ (DUF606 family)
MWIGGLMGLIVVCSITIAQPRIGATATIDRYGLFGVGQIALTWPRLLGIALLAAGAALSLVR